MNFRWKLRSADEQSPFPRANDLYPNVIELLQAATEIVEIDRTSATTFIAEASSLLGALTQRLAVEGEPIKAGLAVWQIRKIEKFIDENMESPIRVEDLSRLVRLRSTYFSRAFRRSFGKAPHAYLTARRLKSAMEFILTSDRSLSEIAHTCGFSDQAHLTRTFRRGVGSSPAAWRRERGGRSPPLHPNRSAKNTEIEPSHCRK
jgi:AraC family transcriptional regulator